MSLFNDKLSVAQETFEPSGPKPFDKQPLDVVIIDDIFPHPLSAFRMQEYTSYLKEFKSLEIYSTGASVGLIGGKTFDELLDDFKLNYPEYAGRVKKLEANTVIHARLIYAVFLINIYLNIQKIEESKTPFVFTLYPGGGFGLHVANSDAMLRRVMSSPCSRKVIVTQKVTYDYLVDNKYCLPEQILFIFGVVTPLEYINIEYQGKKHFGIDKSSLDVCFVAYKYTDQGVDKGYDVFIEVAHRLCQVHDNIRFHVVGGIDEHEIAVTDLEGKITFYGKRDIEWFNSFYKDKDIILSPNIPGRVYPGSFDGFPTGTCVDAGLRKTAIFCTDELDLNTRARSEGKEFIDGEEIVIIPHDASKITTMIDHFYDDPQQLRSIAEKGSLRIKQLFGFETQLSPRINLLKTEVKLADSSKKAIIKRMNDIVHHDKQDSSPTRPGIKNKIQAVLIFVVMKFRMLFQRIRLRIAPAGSRRARFLYPLYSRTVGQVSRFVRYRMAKADLALIRSSSLFDEAWYLNRNPDVARAKMDPAFHYLVYGAFEGRDPGPDFQSYKYLETYPDVKINGMNPLLHYLKYGMKEGRVLPVSI